MLILTQMFQQSQLKSTYSSLNQIHLSGLDTLQKCLYYLGLIKVL